MSTPNQMLTSKVPTSCQNLPVLCLGKKAVWCETPMALSPLSRPAPWQTGAQAPLSAAPSRARTQPVPHWDVGARAHTPRAHRGIPAARPPARLPALPPACPPACPCHSPARQPANSCPSKLLFCKRT